MKKTIIKSLSVMLAVVLTITAAPLSGFVGLQLPEWLDFSIISKAATTGTCGTNVTWEFDEETGTLTISGTGAMDDYESDSHPWEEYDDAITDVVINNGVTAIGNYAFNDCDNLTSVTIPDSVTTIGNYAFHGCNSLTSVTIPDGVTTIGEDAFSWCDKLKSVTIPDSVTTIGEDAFYYCNSLKSVKIPESVTTIGNGAFSACRNITNITVDGNNQYYSSDVFSVFFNKDKTKLINYPAGNTRTSYRIPDSVTTIGNGAFDYCDSLTSVTIPDSVTTIGSWAFSSCHRLKSVKIPDSVTTIGYYVFSSCISFTSVTIPDSVITIDKGAFLGCTSLTSVTIPDSVTTIGGSAFYNCKSLTDVYYSGTEEEWNEITINTGNEPLLNAKIHYNYCEHDYVDGTCTECGRNKPITQEMSSQIRFNRNADGSYAETFDVRTRAMISDKDFTELVGATNAEAIKNIDKVGFVYTVNGESFSATTAQTVAQGEQIAGYVDKPVSYIQDADGYYMFTCLVTGIPEADKNYILTAYAYICVNGKWYFSELPMNADFNSLYETYYPIACEKYGW